MLSAARSNVPGFTPSNSSKKNKKAQPTELQDEEIRKRVFANAAVLFPSSSTQHLQPYPYEIVYGTRPRALSEKGGEEPPWQYAMLVRRNPAGDYTPLLRGQAWSTTVPWSMALQGLLDATATAIHKKLGSMPMPQLGMNEELPRYEEGGMGRSVTQ